MRRWSAGGRKPRRSAASRPRDGPAIQVTTEIDSLRTESFPRTVTVYGGASIVETIFAIPGIGSYAIAGVQSKDYYVVQAYVLFSGCIYVLTNILIDLIYIALDPKIRAGEAVES